MTTLTDFLLARIAEDEEVARKHPGDTLRDDAVYELGGTATDYGDAHITISAARVLAECEAKRRIIEQYDTAERISDNLDYDTRGMYEATELAVTYLAQVYADHPDYQAEWAIA